MSKTTIAKISEVPSDDLPIEYVVLCRYDLPLADYSAPVCGKVYYKSYFSDKMSLEKVIRMHFIKNSHNLTPIMVKRILPERGY